jgi:hypothetical protein
LESQSQKKGSRLYAGHRKEIPKIKGEDPDFYAPEEKNTKKPCPGETKKKITKQQSYRGEALNHKINYGGAKISPNRGS